MTPPNEPTNRGDEPRRGRPPGPVVADWLDTLASSRAHREVRLHADVQGYNFWRDWHHATAGCCGPRLGDPR